MTVPPGNEYRPLLQRYPEPQWGPAGQPGQTAPHASEGLRSTWAAMGGDQRQTAREPVKLFGTGAAFGWACIPSGLSVLGFIPLVSAASTVDATAGAVVLVMVLLIFLVALGFWAVLIRAFFALINMERLMKARL